MTEQEVNQALHARTGRSLLKQRAGMQDRTVHKSPIIPAICLLVITSAPF